MTGFKSLSSTFNQIFILKLCKEELVVAWFNDIYKLVEFFRNFFIICNEKFLYNIQGNFSQYTNLELCPLFRKRLVSPAPNTFGMS